MASVPHKHLNPTQMRLTSCAAQAHFEARKTTKAPQPRCAIHSIGPPITAADPRESLRTRSEVWRIAFADPSSQDRSRHSSGFRLRAGRTGEGPQDVRAGVIAEALVATSETNGIARTAGYATVAALASDFLLPSYATVQEPGFLFVIVFGLERIPAETGSSSHSPNERKCRIKRVRRARRTPERCASSSRPTMEAASLSTRRAAFHGRGSPKS